MSDLLAILSWWLILQIFGFAVWPLAARWLCWLPDRGYMLSKPIGLLFVSYGLWLLATLGVIQNSTGGIVAVTILVAALSFLAYRRLQSPTSNFHPLAWLRDHRTLVIAYELLFVIALIAWAIFRAHNPDLDTTEKPMEFAFFNAIGRSANFPPQDPWLAGYGIAYYYFGYVMMSLLHKLSGITAGTAFGLSNAMWFALSAASAFGVVANLILLASDKAKRAAIGFGVLGAVMLVLMGNFEAPLEVAHANNVGSADFWRNLDILELNTSAVQNPPEVPIWMPRSSGWWWWRASRVIHDYPPNTVSPQLSRVTGQPPAPNTTFVEVIDEFPQFSFLLGDMHPHVLALPFALLMMVLALNLYQGSANGEITSLWSGAGRAPLWPLYALAVGALGFLNTWDFPIYAFVLAAALTLGRWRVGHFNVWESLSDLVVLGVAGFAFYLLFYRGFSSQAAGIAPNLFNGTRAGQFFVMFGPFIVIGLMLGVMLLIEAVRAKQMRWLPFVGKSLGGGIALIAAMSILMGALGFLITRVSKQARDLIDGVIASMAQAGITPTDHLVARLADPWVMLSLGSALAAIFFLWRARRSTNSQLADPQSTKSHATDFVLLLYAIGLLLAFGVEFAFIIDGFGTRMNTVFKFYYQAWALWSVASAFAAWYLLQGSAHIKTVARIIIGAVAAISVGLGLVYPALAIASKTAGEVEPTLDAVQAIASYVPDEYAAVQWLNDNVPGTPTILEAPGDEYNSSTSRISTWTGLPAFVGWSYHELQWRGNYDIQGPRVRDTNEIYTTTVASRALALLKSNNIRYVIVGPHERRLYQPSSLAKFDRLLPIVFRQGALTIYEVP
jgi:YYY domain-containing protein